MLVRQEIVGGVRGEGVNGCLRLPAGLQEHVLFQPAPVGPERLAPDLEQRFLRDLHAVRTFFREQSVLGLC